MTGPVLTTKLYIAPLRPLHSVAPRPRLIERLNAGLHRKLTLISVPAGFGKTALLNKWVSRSILLGVSLCDPGRSLWVRNRKVSIIALGKM